MTDLNELVSEHTAEESTSDGYLNIHVIRSLPYSNVNRDQTGAPKTAEYGGVVRGRVSSQAAKRAARTTFETKRESTRSNRLVRPTIENVLKQIHPNLSEGDVALLADAGRTAQIAELDSPASGKSPSQAQKDKAAAAAASRTAAEGSLGKNAQTDGYIALAQSVAAAAIEKYGNLTTAKPKGDDKTLIWLASDEINKFEQSLVAAYGNGQTGPADLAVTPRTKSLAIALFGRMFANDADSQTDAAVQVAHWFTTHEAVTEVDWFTAVDDRAVDDGNSGAGHLNIGQFLSGVFYQHLNVSRRQFQQNWDQSVTSDPKETLAAAIAALICAVPRGKQNSAAQHGLPALVVVERADCPVSYSTAFEAPIRPSDDGFLQPSVDRFLDYQDKARSNFENMFDGESWVSGTHAPEALAFDDLVTKSAAWMLT